MTAPRRWTAQRRAFRDLILQALDRVGLIEDPTGGYVATLLRIECGLPPTRRVRGVMSSVLGLMHQDGLVDRTTRTTRTYKVSLRQPLTALERERLVASEASNRALVRSREEVDIVALCQDAHVLLCYKAARAVRDEVRAGVYRLNVTAILEELGYGRRHREIVVECLKQAGFMRTVRSEFGGVWWWYIDTERKVSEGEMREILRTLVSTKLSDAELEEAILLAERNDPLTVQQQLLLRRKLSELLEENRRLTALLEERDATIQRLAQDGAERTDIAPTVDEVDPT